MSSLCSRCVHGDPDNHFKCKLGVNSLRWRWCKDFEPLNIIEQLRREGYKPLSEGVILKSPASPKALRRTSRTLQK